MPSAPAPLRSPGSPAEARRRTLYMTVTALTGLAQAVFIAVQALHPQHPTPGWGNVFGLTLCGMLAVMLAYRKLPAHWIEQGTLLIGTAGFLVQLALVAHTRLPMGASTYLVSIFLFVAAFSVLPLPRALFYSTVLYSLVVGVILTRPGPPDLTMAAELVVIILLVVHLSVFGQQSAARRREASQFQTLALTDTLTGLANRRALYPQLSQRFEHPETRAALALLVLDIDHFKRINDQHGHPVGDAVLQRLAMLLQETFKARDVVARWGGEEFLVLLADIHPSQLQAVGERCGQTVRHAPMPLNLRLTVSSGLAHASEVMSVDEWLARADQRLYQAKAAGRDRTVAHDSPWETSC